MKTREFRHFIGDFETTVYSGQEFTEVWASAVVEFGTEDVKVFHSIDETLEYLISLNCNVIIYYHNLKFDGNFWLSHLITKLKWEQAYDKGKNDNEIFWKEEKFMKNNSFKYTISDRGQWYSIVIKAKGHIIEIRDSLKILPLSVKRIGENFKTKHRKLDMEYTGFRYAGCPISDEEKEYIKNDVLVIKEGMELMYSMGHKEMTIGANCLKEYKEICRTSTNYVMDEYDELFPNLYNLRIDPDIHGVDNAGDWIRKSYKGGWCYLAKGKENRIKTDGCTADVNSLYPSMMHSQSGNRYPVRFPCFWSGDFIPDEALKEDRYFFIRIKTRFYLKAGYLPFVQIKNNSLYEGTECLESSDVYDKETGQYLTHYIDSRTGEEHDTRLEITMTCVDYKLFREFYNVCDFQILDGCYFYTQIGIFDDYINKYKEIKQNSEGGVREIAKLFLNNLYGKMASSTDSSFKVCFSDDEGVLHFIPVVAHEKTPGYIPVGSAITSYSRNFTIRAAQANYHGINAPGFIYADTDSIHCDLKPLDLKGITIHPKDFCCWKVESTWDRAIFTRQKTYIEHIVDDDSKKEKPYSNIKCAGMPDKCKELFDLSMRGTADVRGYVKDNIFMDIRKKNDRELNNLELKEWNDAEKEFLFLKGKPIKRTYRDFDIGLKVPDKLAPKRIKGGVLLRETTYEMR